MPDSSSDITPEKKDAIIQKCKEETKIVYAYKSGFFGPKLKGINYLEVGHSKMVTNPITLFLEGVYYFYARTKRWFRRFNCVWFPRHHVISGTEKDAYLVGQLTFRSKQDVRQPIQNMYVVLWARTKFYQWRRLAEGYTDAEGKFRLEFDLRAAVKWINRKQLLFEVNEIENIRYHGGKAKRVYSVFHTQKFPKADLTGMGYNLREIQLDYWNYRQDTTIPRTLLKLDKGDRLQDYTEGRENALYEQIIPIELTKRKHLIQIMEGSKRISYESIQKDYPINLSQCIEKHLPGFSRSDEWFGERMMNGMNCGAFMPDPNEPGVYMIKYFGICDYEHNDIYALPDVIIRFRLNEKGIPIPFKITTRGALNAYNKDPWQTRDFTPDDGEFLWLAAKRIARMTGNVCTEVDEHFVGTHLNVEQYAIATYRNFRKSPLAVLLIPHMREVSLINEGADKIIVNGFLPSGTALKAEGIVRRAKDVLGMFDWKGWKPMESISEDHRYAQAENLFWKVTDEFVESFINEHLDEIILHWSEVYGFSQDLVNHSVPMFLTDKDLNAMPEPLRNQYLERFEYYKFQYGLDENHPRERVNGELKVVSPITHKKSITKADTEDIDNLKKALKYAVMQATFMHTWINEHQYDDLGEVLYSCGGLRFGPGENGILTGEDDMHVAPDLSVATQQLWFANFLSRTEYGFITKDEDGDVHPHFSHLLKAKREEFKRIGVDIDTIESRTNI